MKKIRLGITIGDSNGIGLETIIKTFSDNRMIDFCTPIVFGSSKIAQIHRRAISKQDFTFNIINSIDEINPKKTNLINIDNKEIDVNFGKASIESASLSYLSIQKATDAFKNNRIDIIVTAPINKISIQQKVNTFIGHTEFFEEKFNSKAVMIMTSDIMKIAFVTSHIPLSKISKHITEENIILKAKKFNHALIQDFGIRKPKIAVLSLNPHAGENGLLGAEENDIISPAIDKLKENNILAFGPYPTDSFFSSNNLKAFDGILSMYHDQGLTPFKTLSFNRGVNFTAGLEVIRTSPVHGTAYQIAGEGLADESSFREAVFLACKIFKKRLEYSELNKNPLSFKDVSKS